jgi:hypothetical protein
MRALRWLLGQRRQRRDVFVIWVVASAGRAATHRTINNLIIGHWTLACERPRRMHVCRAHLHLHSYPELRLRKEAPLLRLEAV